jgi:hypothetical protein
MNTAILSRPEQFRVMQASPDRDYVDTVQKKTPWRFTPGVF